MGDLGTSEASSSTRPANHLARWWEPETGGKVHCYLCPRHCHIGQGQAGFCFIRANQGGKLYSLGYAHPAALQIDPIEKKPLNHFLPGTNVFSVGTAGCNMGCFFCQNWSISKSKSDQRHSTYMPPEEVVEMAIENNCPSIAFTYNEPTIWGEYVIDICKVAHEHGLKTVMVSNGYVTYEAFHDIYDHIDAANIDLKAFTEKFYGGTTLTHLQPVLDTLKWLKKETSVWFEITNLLIPTLNDAPSETRALCEWILENLGPDVPLHFTAFHPDFKLRDKPRTPEETLHAARAIALDVGLHYVYEGNIRSGNAHTQCPSCNSTLIRRSWHNVLENRLAVSYPPARSVHPGLANFPAAAILPDSGTAPAGMTEQILQQEDPLRNLADHFGSRISDAADGRSEALSQIANTERDVSTLQGRRLPNEQRPPSAAASDRSTLAPDFASKGSIAQHCAGGTDAPAADSASLEYAIVEESLLSQDLPRRLDAHFDGATPTANQRRRAMRWPVANAEPAATCPDCSLVIPGRWSVASTRSAGQSKR
jgi:pyruvate formate lyase activating enzyme